MSRRPNLGGLKLNAKSLARGVVLTLVVLVGLTTFAPPAGASCPDNQPRCARLGTTNPGGWNGYVGGPTASAPNSGASWASASSYGRIATGTRAAEAKTMTWIEKLAGRLRVPWPRTGTTRASDMSTYRVYQIYGPGEKGGSRVYKYGITKAGERRPKSQLKACRSAFGNDCSFSWLRNDVSGWYRARKVEAGYASKYKARFERCPPGMKRCL